MGKIIRPDLRVVGQNEHLCLSILLVADHYGPEILKTTGATPIASLLCPCRRRLDFNKNKYHNSLGLIAWAVVTNGPFFLLCVPIRLRRRTNYGGQGNSIY